MAFRLELSVDTEHDFGSIFGHLLNSYLQFGASSGERVHAQRVVCLERAMHRLPRTGWRTWSDCSVRMAGT